MQRQRKRLSFTKETIRVLTGNQLGRVAGGLIKTDGMGACSQTVSPDCQTAYCNSDPCTTSFCATSINC